MGLVTFETLWSRNVFELANLYSFFGYDAAYPELAPFKTSKNPKKPQIRFNSQHKSPGRTRKLTNGLFKGRVQEV